MKNPLNKILLALVILIFIPVGLVLVFELSKLNDNEKLINNAYKNQLESIVTSLNSYTQDIANSWASRIELAVKNDSVLNSPILSRLMNENQPVQSIYISNLDKTINQLAKNDQSTCNAEIIKQKLNQQEKDIQQLISYYKSNYRKLSTAQVDANTYLIYFICDKKNGYPLVCFVEIQLNEFLINQVGARMQSIAQDNIIITLSNEKTKQIIYSTQANVEANTKYDYLGKLWLFPDIQIEISLKNQTIDTLAKKRAKESMLLFGFVLLFLIAGIWFLYLSIKREIQLAQIKSEFISNVSHEIRTPLSLISMYIETLEMGRVKSADKINEYYQIISKETQRLIGIVNKILNFSKMEKGKRQFTLNHCNLNLITRELLETYEFHFKANKFEYTFTPIDNIPSINCDKEAIGEAIINLIDNAIKYSNDKKLIEIKTGIENNYTFVEVKDFGLGISKKHQKLVFDKFYRVANENLAYKTKGTGLGLAIVNEIVKTHKGKITIQSKIDEGSTFRLYFPII